MPNNHLRQSGFTLIEILVVIVIIAIIATAAVLQLGILDSPRTAKLAVNLFDFVIILIHFVNVSKNNFNYLVNKIRLWARAYGSANAIRT